MNEGALKIVHFVRAFDLENEIKRMESTPIGYNNRPIGVTSNEKTVTIDLSLAQYRTLIIDVYGIEILNTLLSGEYKSYSGEHKEGGRFKFDRVNDNIWKITEYILD